MNNRPYRDDGASRDADDGVVAVNADPKTAAVIARLESAKAAIAQAESELDAAVGDVEVARRAEKITLNTALTQAFTNLRAAKAALVTLEDEITVRAVDRGEE